MVKKVKALMKAHFFDPSDQVSMIEFRAILKLVCDMNNIHRKVSLWLLLFFVKNDQTTTLNCVMSAAARNTSVVASVNTIELLIQEKILPSYLEVVNYLLKKIANDRAIAEVESRILRCSRAAHMNLMQYVDDLNAKICKVAGVYDELALNNIFV